MAKKKTTTSRATMALVSLMALLMFLLGAATGYRAKSTGLTPEECAERIATIGGPQYAIAYVCNGASFSIHPDPNAH